MASKKPAKRKGISARTRFEIFKRDCFTCQYCGQKAPDILLHIDHIEAVANGGSDEIINLVTSCSVCNSGKSDVALSDDSAVKRQHIQLQEMNERQEQLQMMLKWRKGLLAMEQESLNHAIQIWHMAVEPFQVTEVGLREVRILIRRFGLELVLRAIDIATDQYLKFGNNQKPTKESVHEAWRKLSGICANEVAPPEVRCSRYCMAILKRRGYINYGTARDYLDRAFDANIDHELLIRTAKRSRNWNEWQCAMDQLLGGDGRG